MSHDAFNRHTYPSDVAKHVQHVHNACRENGLSEVKFDELQA